MYSKLCQFFEVCFLTGDVIVFNTNLWYHATKVENNEFALCIANEYITEESKKLYGDKPSKSRY